ncbi:DUF3820 family protein [Mucilaginibacter terrae]|uniref:Uncharacterized protein (DUF3820 family) n=1 Tax=Mucilaginibacter terrae TaxID=1955052 RepID=A0ABU3GQ13_9SPHI|nr:DUF3820 family protein [Mucilaginibacter terrae]MDT3401571.1 uncharacterized protein (DUF3820 family) [Mucilaginibacter terrae]
MEPVQPNNQVLIDIVNTAMPFGKHKGLLLCDLPVSYLEWMHSKGMPAGKLGMMLSTVYEIKINGLMPLLQSVKNKVRRG